jgi:hypothetical protein
MKDKRLDIPAKVTGNRGRVINQEKVEERENWHKLVVRIIRWKDGNFENVNSGIPAKITPKEWQMYQKKSIQMNVTHSKDRVAATIKETWDNIKKNGGFLED